MTTTDNRLSNVLLSVILQELDDRADIVKYDGDIFEMIPMLAKKVILDILDDFDTQGWKDLKDTIRTNYAGRHCWFFKDPPEWSRFYSWYKVYPELLGSYISTNDSLYGAPLKTECFYVDLHPRALQRKASNGSLGDTLSILSRSSIIDTLYRATKRNATYGEHLVYLARVLKEKGSTSLYQDYMNTTGDKVPDFLINLYRDKNHNNPFDFAVSAAERKDFQALVNTWIALVEKELPTDLDNMKKYERSKLSSYGKPLNAFLPLEDFMGTSHYSDDDVKAKLKSCPISEVCSNLVFAYSVSSIRDGMTHKMS
jgi:hypothetical protein